MKLLTAILFLFVSFQTFGRRSLEDWQPAPSMNIQCRFTAAPYRIQFPMLDCSGDNVVKTRNHIPQICKASIECKNQEGITIQFPSVICNIAFPSLTYSNTHPDYTYHDKCINNVDPIECLFGSKSIYKNQWLMDMLPEEMRPSPSSWFTEEFIRGIQEQ